MRARPLLPFLALAALCTGCGLFGLSDEERGKLAFYQENSALYYGAGRYDKAIVLVEKGLEIEPDDYKLLATGAWCKLQRIDQQPALLDECAQEFERLWDMRSPEDHGAPVLLGQGRTQKLVAGRHWERARVLRDDATAPDRDPSERAVLEAEASEHSVAADYHFKRAKRALEQLLENELDFRLAHRELMDIAIAQDDYEGAVRHGLATLEYNHREQQELLRVIEETFDVQVERTSRVSYQSLIDEETRIRGRLAEMHYRRGNLDQALAQLDELIEMDPTQSTLYYNRARVLQDLGRLDEARRDYQKFLSSTKLPVGHEKVTHAFEFTRKHRPQAPEDV